MAEFKLNRLRYKWRNVWTTGEEYNRDDIIRVGSKTFVCLVGHTAASSFYTDLASLSWTQMSEGSAWRGEWATTTLYNVNDLVYYGGLVYICATSHTSASLFDTNIADWAEYVSTSQWTNDWQAAHRFGIGDLVKYNGIVYRCIQGHTSSSTSNGLEVGNNDAFQDSTSETWTVYNSGIEYRGNWDNGVRYRLNDLVKYAGTIWKCVIPHTSGDDSTNNFSPSNFVVELRGEQFLGDWDEISTYGIGDVVRYGGYLYVCARNDVNEIPSLEPTAWTVVTKNYNVRGEWARTSSYKTGDVVSRGGQLFVATGDNSGAPVGETTINVTVGTPGSGGIGNKYYFDDVVQATPVFEIGKTYTFVQNDLTNVYYPNATGTTLNAHPLIFSTVAEPVAHPNNLFYTEGVVYFLDELEVSRVDYIAGFATAATRKVQITITSQTPSTLYYWCFHHRLMGSTITVTPLTLGAEPSIGSNWLLLVPGERWVGGWESGVEYAVGDLVAFSSSTYRCITAHRSLTNENFPTNGSGFNYWTVYLSGDDDNALANKGDLLAFGARSDGSTLGTIAVPVGTERELLTVQDGDTFGYVEHGQTYNYLYVAPEGSDAAGRGLTAGTPFKTIRHACEYAEENFTGFTTINVRTGHYYEVLPIVVPAGTALVGEEVRAVIVEPAPAVANLSLDVNYTTAVLARLRDIIPMLVLNQPVVRSTGNTVEQNTDHNVGTTDTANAVVSMVDDIIDYLNFHINGTGSSSPALFGTNTALTTEAVLNTLSALEGNRDFLVAEAIAFMRTNFSNYVFDTALCQRDVNDYIDAFKWDLTYSSNYKSILAARYYRNAVLGSIGEDMFYARNASGVRNMTLQGLSGELNDPIELELYRRPSAGAYVSLDPGFGPTDTRCWITSRSPYIQNCCTFGYGAVGQKIDGSLHNGGYKSMVSNDFTQIISDGIGAWVLNGGRAELVSVFTYYSQIGYFAEHGGIIRATNGNNSYGDYGALADGNDPTEVPRYGFVNNELNEAQVVDAFAGEVNDEILALEFSNAGQSYTSAAYQIVGSGTGAVVYQEDFRDNAIFDPRIVVSPSGGAGGGGWTSFGNNAQLGNLTSITLASNDPHTPEQVIGLRLIITSGTGTGQYGWIQDYNEITKVATIYKESTNTPGWDHIVPGFPLVNPLTTSAVYRVEPRPAFSAPSFTTSTSTLSSLTAWSAIAYGETSGSWTVAGAVGAGVVVGDDGLIPITATWNVTKSGRTYTVTLNNPGAGYLAGQVITLDGALFDGAFAENDIVITVSTVTDDSTNAIETFTFTGYGASGRFVATPLTTTAGSATIDGQTWVPVAFPSAGNWKGIAAGGNKFVAVRYNSAQAASSLDGLTWTTTTLPASRNWNSVVYGNGVFLAIASDLNSAAYSTDGVTWSSTTLPTAGDSTYNEWIDVAYGAGRFVVVANSGNISATGEYSTISGWTWTPHVMDSVSDSSQLDWTSVAYGNNRFVAVSSQGAVAYSFTGTNWYSASMPSADDSTEMAWKQIRYGQGVFFAICDTGNRVIGGDATTGPTNYAATSPDGILWTGRTLPTVGNYKAIGFGNPDITPGDSTATNSKPTWIALQNGPVDILGVPTDVSDIAVVVNAGATALGRCVVTSGFIDKIKLWDPGSGYTTSPTLTVTDPSNTAELYVQNRLADGVLAQPSWYARGVGYKTSSTVVTVTGDGYADIIPIDRYVVLDSLEILPGPGAQFRFGGRTDYYTVVTIEREGVDANGLITGRFQISPTLTIADDLQHGVQVEIRERYSQIRITGHDFLDVGTGNLIETNYPTLYSTGNYVGMPEQEIAEREGGRVFYTSTDQDGNFRTGELFAVEQATGIVTISADFFDLNGLTELALGGVRLGGSGTVIREFSTDPLFTADSNNVIPTQRAIKAYLQNRLSVGGSDLQIPSFIAGVVQVGPTTISTLTDVGINLPKRMDFGNRSVRGTMLAQTMFHSSFNTD